MNRWKMLLVQLFMLTSNVSGKDVLIDLVGGEPYAEPICSNSTQNIITLVVCKISMSSGKDCQLFYRHKYDFEDTCDSKVRLMKEKHTILLDLTHLTPTDGGNHTCECSYPFGTETLHLSITVRGGETTNSSAEKFVILLVTGVIIVILTGVLLGCICRKIRHCKRRRQDPLPASPVTGHVEEIEPYSTFMQRENGLYSISVMPNRITNANNSPRLTRV